MGVKKPRRMSKSAIVYIPVGALLIVLLTILGTSGFLSVMEIEVDGVSMYSAAEVAAVSGISLGDNLLFVDTSAASRRIQVAMPFISAVNITRVPPARVRIEVQESIALATIAARSDVIVIDSAGRVLQRSASAPAGLIEVRGITPREAIEGGRIRAEQGGDLQLQNMLDVLAAIEREGIQRDISYLDVNNIAQISFGYMGRFRVILGGPNNLRQKLTSLAGAIARFEERESAVVTGTWRAEATGDWLWIPDF